MIAVFYRLNRIYRPLQACLAVISIANNLLAPALARAGSATLPEYSQMASGAGPATNDGTNIDEAGATPENARRQQSDTAGLDLTPITPDAASSNSGSRKLRQQQKQFAQGARMLGVQLGPLQLRETEDEAQSKSIKLVDTENVQLSDLWDAAMENNPDIKFVVQRLTPVKDPRHASATVTKMLSSVIYGAVAAGGIAMPSLNNANSTINRAGVNLIQNALNGARSKGASRTPLSETEALMLYNVVRGVAEKLVDNFHEYKKYLSSQDMAREDFNDLHAIAGDAAGELSIKDRIELEYFLRKAKREINATEFDLSRSRRALIDLAGSPAVTRLDEQINIEMAKNGNGTEVDSQADIKIGR